MQFNRFIIQHLMESKFKDIVKIKVANDVRNLDEYDISNIFFKKVDIVSLNRIVGINVEQFEIAKSSIGMVVSGEMSVGAELNGFVIKNSNLIIVGGGMLSMGYFYRFTEQNGDYKRLELKKYILIFNF